MSQSKLDLTLNVEKEVKIDLLFRDIKDFFEPLSISAITSGLVDANAVMYKRFSDSSSIMAKAMLRYLGDAATGLAIADDVAKLQAMSNGSRAEKIKHVPNVAICLMNIKAWLDNQAKPLSEDAAKLSKSLYVYARCMQIAFDQNKNALNAAIYLGQLSRNAVTSLFDGLSAILKSSVNALSFVSSTDKLDDYFQTAYAKNETTEEQMTYLVQVEDHVSDLLLLREMQTKLSRIQDHKDKDLPAILGLNPPDKRKQELLGRVLVQLNEDKMPGWVDFIKKRMEKVDKEKKAEQPILKIMAKKISKSALKFQKALERTFIGKTMKDVSALKDAFQAEIQDVCHVIANGVVPFKEKLQHASTESLLAIQEKTQSLKLLTQAKGFIREMNSYIKSNNTLYTHFLIFISKHFGYTTPRAELYMQISDSHRLLSGVHDELEQTANHSGVEQTKLDRLKELLDETESRAGAVIHRYKEVMEKMIPHQSLQKQSEDTTLNTTETQQFIIK
jgi:hypothetical protein